MSERVTHAMLTSAMDYLAELLGVQYIPQVSQLQPEPGDITYEDHDMRNARYYFAIYRYETDWLNPNGPRKLGTHRPTPYSFNTRELHDHIRFACTVLHAHRGIVAHAKEMNEL